MTTLHQLLSAITCPGVEPAEIPDRDVSAVTSDSRKVRPGSIYVALRGAKEDGHAYAEKAVRMGCCAVVAEQEVPAAGDTPVIRVADSHLAYGQLAAAFFANPAGELTLIGLTGTNGKTTTSWIIEEMLRAQGKQVGVIGTVNYRYADAEGRSVVRAAPLTTPEPMELQALLREMRDRGVTHVVMEVSSHALVQQRLAGLRFAVGVFTNLSRDHLDFHGSMEAYFAAKQLLFTELLEPDGAAVIVIGPEYGAAGPSGGWSRQLIATLRQQSFTDFAPGRRGRTFFACGLSDDCLVRAVNCAQGPHGFQADFFLGGERLPLSSHLIGGHNILNMLAAAGVGVALGLPPGHIVRGLQGVGQVPGRLERVQLPSGAGETSRPMVFVDYAHTPDALENVLRTLRPVTPGRLFCVFGCGGDRDRGKRPMMGKAAAELADRIVITSDNPRSEDPATILSEIETGVRQTGVTKVASAGLFAGGPQPAKYSVMPDRRQAIHEACALTCGQDVVLIAGKGHETYQITATGKHFFDDRLEAKNGMLRWTVERLLRATSGTLRQQGEALLLGDISTDTRTIRLGDIFLALQGDNFDGHEFVNTAVEKGAAALVVGKPCTVADQRVAIIQVQDTLHAYGELARYRKNLLSSQIQVIAITGSSGKTTVKEMAAAIINMQYGAAASEAVLKTEGNLNNLVGLPRTLLQVNAGHRVAVLEMGMNRPGEIRRLTEAADPDIGCITNVQAAHLEGLGSIDGVARAKGELFAAMRRDGIRIVNCDDRRIRALARRFGGRSVTFAVTSSGRKCRPEVRVTRMVSLGEVGMRFTLHIGTWQRRLSVPATGAHNVGNCAAAAAIATAAGIAPEVIARGLAAYRSGDKRLQIVRLPGGISLLNDAYNANPGSMAAALRTASTFGRNCRRAAVLGDMLELGESAPAAHRQIGELAAELGLDYLAVTGEHAAVVAEAARAGGMGKNRIKECVDTDEAARWLAQLIEQQKIRQGDWVLLKGSRGMRMERVLTGLTELLSAHGN
ncbi:MAG TPA: UDP-N-acetylmuramoyl-L-alanyl-D-glutamate--2,6-diaminopimelate ligase [Desulfobulbaceae bacterium]|nr:UDP-N-acetylmuramoyl-L-alanyl-D-glutamate--2,6-diaminopimelate ligase [Desulfobulbaceae bacterium]